MSSCVNATTKRLLGGAWALALFVTPHGAQATTFKVLYSFTGGSGGGNPAGSLITDADGNLYGTGAQPTGVGSIFKLAPNGDINTYYLQKGGAGPEALVMDKRGNLWVTVCCGGLGGGLIMKITPTGRETIVHTFEGSPNDGSNAFDALIVDKSGNFWGTSTGGGKYNEGTVFELAPDGSESLLHSFGSKRGGFDPFAGLIMDVNGNLYGADADGGAKDFGTVFKIAPDGAETVLYTFKGPPIDGSVPDGTLITDQSGNFYGTFRDGGLAGCEGNEGCGAVYKLAPDGVETILHFFTGEHGDGGNSVVGLIADSAGNLYGTTYYGGGSCTLDDVYGCGTVFKIAPDDTETILYSFGKKNGANGAFPAAGLVADSSGNLYGTASSGGADGYGTVFEITP